MSQHIPTSEVLYRAADLIEERGWWQAGGGGTPGGTCASNAIVSVVGQAYDPAHGALATYLGGEMPRDIFDWNDAPERTATEVIEVLRACAVIEADKENADVRESVTVR